MKFLRDIQDNIRIILVLSKRLLLLENKVSENNTDISNIQVVITQMLKRIKELENYMDKVNNAVTRLDHSMELKKEN